MVIEVSAWRILNGVCPSHNYTQVLQWSDTILMLITGPYPWIPSLKIGLQQQDMC